MESFREFKKRKMKCFLEYILNLDHAINGNFIGIKQKILLRTRFENVLKTAHDIIKQKVSGNLKKYFLKNEHNLSRLKKTLISCIL